MKKLIIDGKEKGTIKEYYQNRKTKAWIFVLYPTPGKESSKKFILFFDEIKRMSNDKDWNIDILTY